MRIRIALLVTLAAVAFTPAAQAQARLPEVIKITDAVAAGGKTMTGNQIKEMFIGNTVYYVFLTQLFGMPRGSLNPTFFRDARTKVQLWKGNPRSVRRQHGLLSRPGSHRNSESRGSDYDVLSR